MRSKMIPSLFVTTTLSLLSLMSATAQPKPDGGVDDATRQRAMELWSTGPRVAAFQAVRWHESTPEVQVNATWYELLTLNDVPADQIVAFARSIDPKDWQKRFEEDLPAVLILMDHKPGDTVSLNVKNLQSGKEESLQKVAMTEENRRSIMQTRGGAQNGGAAARVGAAWQGFPRLSPFQAVRWREQTPEVQVNDTWYELLAINDIPADKIVAFSESKGKLSAQKHFEEDLVELLTGMGHQPGQSATLKLKDLSSGKEQVLKDVPMTAENRNAIWQAGMERDKAH